MTFKSRLAFWFSGILAVNILIAGLVFAGAYYAVSLVNLEKFIIREGKEILDKHFQLTNERIIFKKDENGKTLASYLIDEGISAKIIDKKGETVGKYGIFNSGNINLEQLVGSKEIGEISKNYRDVFLIKNNKKDTYLLYIKPMMVDENPVGYLVLGSNMNIGQQMLTLALVLLVLIAPFSTVTGWILTKIMVGREFAPLETILEKMQKLELGTLKEKIQVSGNENDELVRLARSYNHMLTRLGSDVKKQKEFIANASHELKSPLTKAVLKIETVKMQITDRKLKAAKTELEKLQHELKKHGDVIGSLLEIAKVSNTNADVSRISVRKSIRKVIDDNQTEILKNKLKIILIIPSRLQFIFPEIHWKILIDNLLNNALKYSRKNSQITILAGEKRNSGYLTIENSPAHHINLRKIWKRFYTKNETGISTGYGIGLSLVNEIVQANKLKISNENNKERFAVTVLQFHTGSQ